MRQIGDMGSWHMEFMDWQDVIRIQLTFFLGLQTVTDGIPTGDGNCPILGILDITKNSSHYRPNIPNGS